MAVCRRSGAGIKIVAMGGSSNVEALIGGRWAVNCRLDGHKSWGLAVYLNVKGQTADWCERCPLLA